MSEVIKPAGYGTLLTELKNRIHTAQYAALRAVNKELIALYWDIGKLIEERQETEGWGKAVVERLSADLRAEFGEKSGFSGRDLWYMRTFYREYKEQAFLQPLDAEIAWTKNTLILDRCQNLLQREFYLRATARFGWTRRVLEHQIDNQTYEKYPLIRVTAKEARYLKRTEIRIDSNLDRTSRTQEPIGARIHGIGRRPFECLATGLAGCSHTDRDPIAHGRLCGDSEADMSKTTTLLGYQPSHRVSKGLKVAIEWHVNKEVK